MNYVDVGLFSLAFNMTGSNTWNRVTVEGNMKPPSLQDHTALTYKVTDNLPQWLERAGNKKTHK